MWQKHLPNLSKTSRVGKSMSELSRRWKKHANPRKWRKSHEGWVGNKSTQFPSLTSFTLSIEKHKKKNKEESTVKCCILIIDGQKVVNINPKLEINNS